MVLLQNAPAVSYPRAVATLVLSGGRLGEAVSEQVLLRDGPTFETVTSPVAALRRLDLLQEFANAPHRARANARGHSPRAQRHRPRARSLRASPARALRRSSGGAQGYPSGQSSKNPRQHRPRRVGDPNVTTPNVMTRVSNTWKARPVMDYDSYARCLRKK